MTSPPQTPSMCDEAGGRERYFLTYRDTRLPLQLTEELPAGALRHRNTYFRARYDALDRLIQCEKLVYGEVEVRHCYEYDAAGRLCRAIITVGDEEPQTLCLDPAPLPSALPSSVTSA